MPGDADAMLGQAGRQARQRWRQAGRQRQRQRQNRHADVCSSRRRLVYGLEADGGRGKVSNDQGQDKTRARAYCTVQYSTTIDY